jgi:HAD superfamily hydrolase (TIGR01509 family)
MTTGPNVGSVRWVLLDVDGTLIDTWDLYIETFLRSMEDIVGRRLSFEELLALHPTSELRVLRQALDSDDELPGAHEGFLAHMRDLHPELFAGVYDGVPEMLDGLRRQGLVIGLVTGKSRGAWAVTEPVVSLGDFAVAIMDDDVRHPKPSPEGILAAVARLGAVPGATVYVGDSVADARAARAAGVRFAAALWAKSDHERPDFVEKVTNEGAWALLPAPGALVELVDGQHRRSHHVYRAGHDV